jgi:hypothetical protein
MPFSLTFRRDKHSFAASYTGYKEKQKKGLSDLNYLFFAIPKPGPDPGHGIQFIFKCRYVYLFAILQLGTKDRLFNDNLPFLSFVTSTTRNFWI